MEPFIGQIQMWGLNFAPRGWAFCNGQLLPIAQNTALFSLLGTIYGGDGRTTFGLPDLRGRTHMQSGSGPGLPSYSIGQRGGIDNQTLLATQVPSHNHSVNIPVTSDDAQGDSPVGNVFSTTEEDLYSGTPTSNNFLRSFNSGNTGGNAQYNIDMPSLTITICIALTGLFPSRS